MKYFAYGMNTNLEEMARRCPGAVSLGPAWIDNYELAFRTHADIQKQPGSRCWGVLWEIDDKHLESLDALEGFPYYYTRFRVMVTDGKKRVGALVYQMKDQTTVDMPGAGYLSCVCAGYQANGVPQNQIEHAINMVCSLSNKTNAELAFTPYATT